MAISFVGSVTTSTAGTTGNFAVGFSLLRNEANVQPTLLAGDTIYAVVSTGSTVDRTLSAAASPVYTKLTPELYSNGTSFDTNLAVFRRRLPVGFTETDFTVSGGSGSTADALTVGLIVLRGVDETTPEDVTPVTATGTATGRPDPGSINPATSGAWVIVLGAGAAGSGAVLTNPGSYSSTTNHFRSSTQNDTNDSFNVIAIDETNWTSGAVDPAQFTGGTTNAADSWAAYTIAVKPSSVDSHAATGALTGQGSSVAGSAAHIAVHTSTGALVGPGSIVAGAASSATPRPSSGALIGPGSAIAGSAARTRQHATTGVLIGPGSALAGTAARVPAPVTHTSTGALVGPGSLIDADVRITTPGKRFARRYPANNRRNYMMWRR
jgi:hypothetical protein